MGVVYDLTDCVKSKMAASKLEVLRELPMHSHKFCMATTAAMVTFTILVGNVGEAVGISFASRRQAENE